MFLCDLNRKIMIMMFNATFNNISVLLVEETKCQEKTTDLTNLIT